MVDMGVGYQKSGDLLWVEGKILIGQGLRIRTLAHAAVYEDIAAVKLNQMAGTRYRLGRAAELDLHPMRSFYNVFNDTKYYYTIYFSRPQRKKVNLLWNLGMQKKVAPTTFFCVCRGI
jgi:hypothetical protein